MSNKNPRKVYVSNISRDTRERDLGRLFEEVGRIERLQFKNRFAFVEYETSRGCEDSVQLSCYLFIHLFIYLSLHLIIKIK